MEHESVYGTDMPVLVTPATVLVTGGAGFIGSHLCHALVARGLRVRAFDNLSTGALANLYGLEAEMDFVEADVTDLGALTQAMRGVDFVLHQAALPSVSRSIEQPLASHAANATGTLNVLIAAHEAGVRRVVYASSSSVYGDSAALPKRESMAAAPISPYAAAKLTGEHYCHVFHRLHGLEVVVLRYFNVFGPRQDCDSPYAAVIPRFIKSLLAGEPPTVYGDGEQSRDFTYVGNVVQANLLALTVPDAAGGVFNIACQKAITLNQLYRAVQGALQVIIPPRYAPARPGEARHSLADISRAESVLGYQPIIDLQEGLQRTVRYWRGQDPQSAHGQEAIRSAGPRPAPSPLALPRTRERSHTP